MELLILAVVGLVVGAAIAVTVWIVIWRATGNAFDWLIHTFGNERAAAEIEKKWREKESDSKEGC